jgi:hypothetical protein
MTKKAKDVPLKKTPKDLYRAERLIKMVELRWDNRLTLGTIGKRFGISRERVRQILVEYTGSSGPRAPMYPVALRNLAPLHMLGFWGWYGHMTNQQIAEMTGCAVSSVSHFRSKVFPSEKSIVSSRNKALVKEGKRLCQHCREPVALEDFHLATDRPGGVQPICKICLRRYNNARNRAEKEGIYMSMELYRSLPADHRWLAPPKRGKYAATYDVPRSDRATGTSHTVVSRLNR